MINCEWIRKQKKERPSLGSSPGPKCKPNVRLRVRCANTQQPCFSALCDAWLLRKRDEIRESSYIKYRAILERHIKPRLGSRRLGGICTASVDAFTRELLETDGLLIVEHGLRAVADAPSRRHVFDGKLNILGQQVERPAAALPFEHGARKEKARAGNAASCLGITVSYMNRRKRFCDRSGDPEYRSAFLQGGIDGGKE